MARMVAYKVEHFRECDADAVAQPIVVVLVAWAHGRRQGNGT